MYPEAVEAIDAVGVKDVVVAGEPGGDRDALRLGPRQGQAGHVVAAVEAPVEHTAYVQPCAAYVEREEVGPAGEEHVGAEDCVARPEVREAIALNQRSVERLRSEAGGEINLAGGHQVVVE